MNTREGLKLVWRDRRKKNYKIIWELEFFWFTVPGLCKLFGGRSVVLLSVEPPPTNFPTMRCAEGNQHLLLRWQQSQKKI